MAHASNLDPAAPPEPPFEGSSVPQCVCATGEVCPCERYARRAEQCYYHEAQKRIAADRYLAQAASALAEIPLSRRRAIAEATVRAAREVLV